jgi:uncharacterized membrane protein
VNAIAVLNTLAWAVVALIAIIAAHRVVKPRQFWTEEEMATHASLAMVCGVLVLLRLALGAIS